MSAFQPKPAQRVANVIIAILVICSVGALWDVRHCGSQLCEYGDKQFRMFWLHVPFYVLAAVVVSEIVSWGFIRKIWSTK